MNVSVRKTLCGSTNVIGKISNSWTNGKYSVQMLNGAVKTYFVGQTWKVKSLLSTRYSPMGYFLPILCRKTKFENILIFEDEAYDFGLFFKLLSICTTNEYMWVMYSVSAHRCFILINHRSLQQNAIAVVHLNYVTIYKRESNSNYYYKLKCSSEYIFQSVVPVALCLPSSQWWHLAACAIHDPSLFSSQATHHPATSSRCNNKGVIIRCWK